MARYINFLEDFNYKLAHIPDACNRADALSRRPDHDDGSNDNDQVVALQAKIEGARLVGVTKQGVTLLFKGKKFFLKVD